MRLNKSNAKDCLECEIRGVSNLPDRDFTIIDFTTELLSFFRMIRYLTEYAGKLSSTKPIQIIGSPTIEHLDSYDEIDSMDYFRIWAIIKDDVAGLYCELGPNIENSQSSFRGFLDICIQNVLLDGPEYIWLYSQNAPNTTEWYVYELDCWASNDSLMPHSEFLAMIDRFEPSSDFVSWLKTCVAIPLVNFETREDVLGKVF